MALTYQLTQVGSTTVDLVGGNAYATLENYGQVPAGDKVIETFVLTVQATNRANVRTAVNGIIKMLDKARRWHQTGLERHPVWLQFYTDGETPKQALVYDYEIAPAVKGSISHMLETGVITFANIAITRSRAWESVTGATSPASAYSMTSGGADLGLALTGAGQVPGRISKLIISNPSTTLNRFWIGFHRLRGGVVDLNYLFPRINIGAVYSGVGTTIDVDATGDSNDTANIAFTASTDWATRAYATLPSDNEPDPSALHYVGRWLVLLRARVGAGTVAFARLSVSADDPYMFGVQPTLLHQGPPVQIGKTSYGLFEMGEIQLPLTGWRANVLNDSLANIRLNLDARRISGTGSLYADCFILIPAEHMVVINEIQLSTGKKISVNTLENGSVEAFLFNDSGGTYEAVEGIAVVSARNWVLPEIACVGIVAFDRTAGAHTLADSASFQITYHRRWLGYHE